MDRSEILYEVQRKLIGDLGEVVKSVETNYSDKISNSWVFDYLNSSLRNLKPVRVDAGREQPSRRDFENKLASLASEHLESVQKHVPKIDNGDVRFVVSNFGRMYELLLKRTKVELAGLESLAHNYSSASEVVSWEFDFVSAFDTGRAHLDWANEFIGNLGSVMEYLEELGETLSNKEGFKWNLKAANLYLKNKLEIKLDLKDLPEDIGIARRAVCESYLNYEHKLIESRYGIKK